MLSLPNHGTMSQSSNIRKLMVRPDSHGSCATRLVLHTTVFNMLRLSKGSAPKEGPYYQYWHKNQQ